MTHPTTRTRQWLHAVAVVIGASRPISWINTAFPFAAAYLLTGGGIDWRWVCGTLFFLVPYNIAMYGINDVFDFESDIRNPRKGGVEGTVTDRVHHRLLLTASAVTTVPFLVLLLVGGTWASGVWLVVSSLMVLAYSVKGLRFKEKPFLDSVTSAAHFVTPALVGATMTGNPVGSWFIWSMVAFFLWGMASHALGAIQDVTADRAGGLASIATVTGAANTARLATAWYVLAALILLFLPSPSFIAALAVVPYAVNSGRFMGLADDNCTRARSGWRVFLLYNYLAGAIITITMLASTIG